MKILLFCHQLEIGGTLNAIELASALQIHHGHEVVFLATPGPFLEHVRLRGLRFLSAPPARFHPSWARMRTLREAVEQERPDLLHVWEYYQCLEAYYGEHLIKRVPLSVTSMVMDVFRLLPKSIPTTFGTPELVDKARALGRRHAALLLPPVDVSLNAPHAVDPGPFRTALGIAPDEIVIVTVSRLSFRSDFKFESLYRTIAAVGAMGREVPVRLVIVGEGKARIELEQHAAQVNAALKRPAVIFAGALVDPRTAYAAADIVVGMGGSALRGMAFGKPVVVVGTLGFSAPFTPQTADSFLYRGMFGVGEGGIDNSRLTQVIRGLAVDATRRLELGRFAREFVLEHFTLEKVSKGFSEFCVDAVGSQPSFRAALADGLRTAYVWARERRFWEGERPLHQLVRSRFKFRPDLK